MIVVSDASPLISLAAIDRLDLLRQLYGTIWVPDSVFREAAGAHLEQQGAQEIRQADWIATRPVGDSVLVRALKGELDLGEAEAIALAVELGADLLLVDERLGRRAAVRVGVRVIGILGVLIEAKSRGLLPAVKPSLDDLLRKAGFRVSSGLYERILQEAREQT